MTQRAAPKPADEPSPRITYEEFLERYIDQRAEWVDGEVVPMSPVSDEHQEIVRFLLRILSELLEARPLGRVFYEPFQMKTAPDLPGREPDIFFVRQERLGNVRKAHYAGPGDLVMEIVSPESRGRDRGDKFYEYEKGGVREYWLIDPERQTTEFYILGDDGLFRTVGPDAAGVYHSAVVDGLHVKVDWFWKIPPLREALTELGLR
jgi:Uma2 family endonuclease